eukprot:CAMPEP_0116896928 /NCGR_PEP_ID=MMETSP0467-20121206/6054_1 /TAXON_ID=283647 /ORGANISM="Mesodinium pulex, Strain SPMC105" /LENGTH=80 /DNA_ID=CAMNT_0004568353 /DNA_START=1359 /DNA_END=1601 /DNA_ORIENTATION=+
MEKAQNTSAYKHEDFHYRMLNVKEIVQKQFEQEVQDDVQIDQLKDLKKKRFVSKDEPQIDYNHPTKGSIYDIFFGENGLD